MCIRPLQGGAGVGSEYQLHNVLLLSTGLPRRSFLTSRNDIHFLKVTSYELQVTRYKLRVTSNHRSSSRSICQRRLYFSTRSPRLGAPNLTKSAWRPTARSAIKLSFVSPERCDTI